MNALIKQNGEVIECAGGTHLIVSKLKLGMTLDKFLKTGGVRVMLHNDMIAVEFYNPISDEQNTEINKLLREQPVYTIILANETIEKHRPIRRFDFRHSLVPK